MIQLSELLGHEAIDVATAASAGKVSGLGLQGGRILSVGIGGECVDAAAVRGFDGDVVTFDRVAGALGGAQPVPTDPRGSKVLDVHGDLLGSIADLTITDDGAVDAIQLRGGHAIRGSRLLVIGSYAAIVTIESPSP
jgi:hypothetical protein